MNGNRSLSLEAETVPQGLKKRNNILDYLFRVSKQPKQQREVSYTFIFPVERADVSLGLTHWL